MSRSRPSKLLLLTTAGGGIGGTEMMAVNLAREFSRRGYAVRNAFPDTPQNAALLAWCQAQRVTSETNNALRAIQYPRSGRDMLALTRFIRQVNPDVVNLHYGVSHIVLKDVLAVRLSGRRGCIVTVNHPVALNGCRKRLMTRLAASLSDAVVVISRATRDVLRDVGIPQHKIHLIPCGLPVPADLPTQAEGRARLGVPPDAFVVASVARLVSEKGIGDLIEAMARVPDPCGTLRLVIAGDGPERGALAAQATARLGGRACFLGRVPDTTDLYAATDVFALPTRSEGFGLVYVEAAFHGVPSVGTRVGGVPDAVDDGETGLLVEPGDIDAMAMAIARLRDDPALRRRLGEAARVRAHGAFTEARMADDYAQVFGA